MKDKGHRGTVQRVFSILTFVVGGDIRHEQQHARNIGHLSLLCNQDITCTSFNTNGLLKKETQGKLDYVDHWKNSCNGIYLKTPPECPVEEKFAKESGYWYISRFDSVSIFIIHSKFFCCQLATSHLAARSPSLGRQQYSTSGEPRWESKCSSRCLQSEH